MSATSSYPGVERTVSTMASSPAMLSTQPRLPQAYSGPSGSMGT